MNCHASITHRSYAWVDTWLSNSHCQHFVTPMKEGFLASVNHVCSITSPRIPTQPFDGKFYFQVFIFSASINNNIYIIVTDVEFYVFVIFNIVRVWNINNEKQEYLRFICRESQTADVHGNLYFYKYNLKSGTNKDLFHFITSVLYTNIYPLLIFLFFSEYRKRFPPQNTFLLCILLCASIKRFHCIQVTFPIIRSTSQFTYIVSEK